jgi:hypothetical protein
MYIAATNAWYNITDEPMLLTFCLPTSAKNRFRINKVSTRIDNVYLAVVRDQKLMYAHSRESLSFLTRPDRKRKSNIIAPESCTRNEYNNTSVIIIHFVTAVCYYLEELRLCYPVVQCSGLRPGGCERQFGGSQKQKTYGYSY